MILEKIKNYYFINKDLILKEAGNKPVMFLCLDDNKNYFLKRYYNNKKIILNKDNYEFFINQHVISIFSELPMIHNFYVLDIDIGRNVIRQEIILFFERIKDFIEYLYENNIVYNRKKYRIIRTTNGYHVFIKTVRESSQQKKMDELENVLFNYNDLSKNYVIGKNPKKNIDRINIDLTPMKPGGGHVLPYSVNKNYTIAIPVDFNNLFEVKKIEF